MKRAAWIMPTFLEGSGGHRTIFQNIQYLIEQGYECDVYVEDNGCIKNEKELKSMSEKYYGACDCNFHLGFNVSGEYDIVFATAWYTAKVVRDLKTNAKKAYFIQDFEACFNPMGDGYLLACNSYCYGLEPITIGRWLTNKMNIEYGLHSQYFDFCADNKVYKKMPSQKENAICFIHQPDKPRRCSVIGIEALGIVKHLRPDIKIYLYGSNMKGNVWFGHENLGIIPIYQCNELYNKCKVGLCISSSNPSRIPFEMMATGLPVIDLHMENNLYDMPNDCVSLAHYTPESIAEAIINVLDNEEMQNKMSNAGIEYMKEKSLEYGFNQFYNAVENIINNTVSKDIICEKVYTHEPVIADVFSPCKSNVTSYSEVLNNKGRLINKMKNIPFVGKSKIVRAIWHKLKYILR